MHQVLNKYLKIVLIAAEIRLIEQRKIRASCYCVVHVSYPQSLCFHKSSTLFYILAIATCRRSLERIWV